MGGDAGGAAMIRLDFKAINAEADLLRLCGGELKKVASSRGGEWAGPCPLCGGTDRFHIQPYCRPQPRWLCRKCTAGAWRSPLDLVILWKGLTALEAAKWLRAAAGRTPPSLPHAAPKGGQPKPDDAPGEKGRAAWEARARQATRQAAEALWDTPQGELALDWLLGRGLSVSSVHYFLLGLSAGGEQGGVYVPPGILIPWLEKGVEVAALKIALLAGQKTRCAGCGKLAPGRQPCARCGRVNKYTGVKGSRPGLYNSDELWVGCGAASPRPILFVEGELDCIIAWQALRDRAAVVSLGSAVGALDLARWGARLLSGARLICVYDNDPAGEAGRKKLAETVNGAITQVHLPDGVKDITDFVLAGGDLTACLGL